MNPFDSNRLLGLMRQYLFGAVCTILSLLLSAGIWIIWQDVRTNEALNRERSQEFDSMLSTIVSGPLIRQEFARAQDAIKKIDGNLVTESKVEENYFYFYQIKTRTNADVLFLKQQATESSNDGSEYKVIPYTIQLAGTYTQLAAFLLELETGPKLAQIRAFSFKRRELGEDSLTLNIELRLLGKR
ncbi:MAG: hypothetical protein JWM32_1330 [Verrucomicrobia bacterium]|nr:hypothetical protein [Verrucomicrobiota bacterium]